MTDISNETEIITKSQPTLVSTFELLVKPITPATAPGTEAVARTVIQGYFLTIANTSSFDVKLTLRFTATTPELNVTDTVTISDVQGTNDFSDLTPVPGDSSRFTFTVGIGANDTALITLLPDVTNIEIIKAAKLEIRGYVEIFVNSPSAPTPVNLLLTPEHRGTFLPQNLDAPNLDFDQLAYSLPTSTGGSLFKVTGPVFKDSIKDSKELKIEVKEVDKRPKEKDFEKAQVEKLPETDQLANPTPVEAANDLQRLIGLMAQRLDQIEQRTANGHNGQSFIQAKERPSVGQQVVNQPRN